MEDEKRKAGSYEIIQAFHIGDREIVLGEDLNARHTDLQGWPGYGCVW